MKQIAALCLLIAGIYFNGNSQCTPDATCPNTQVVCPSTLASGCISTAYSQTVTIAVPPTITSGTSTYTLVKIRLNSLTGLPSGVIFSCNPSNCTFNGNTRGCILLSGTPTVTGNFPLTANVTVTIQVSFFQVPLDTVIPLGSILINPKDCAGVCGGGATIDNCGRCSGGTTGLLPNCNDNNACTTDGCNGLGGCINTQSCQTISGKIQTEGGTAIPGVTINLTGTQTQSMVTGSDGLYSFTVARNGNYTVTPSKSNDVTTNNGITTLDISLIRNHVLGNTYLTSPYKTVAADGSNSQSISTVDITATRRVVLNNTVKFPNNRMWEFVSSSQTFTVPPLDTPYNPYPLIKTRTYSNVIQNFTNQNFIGIKLGDVNGNWNAGIP